MSIEAITCALHHSRATGATKLILIGIANHCGPGGAYPSVATLAKYAGVSARSVQNSLKELIKLGEVAVLRNKGGARGMDNGRRPNLYGFLLECPAECDGSTNHRAAKALRGEAGFTPGVQDSVPPGVKPASPKPSTEPDVEPSFLSSPDLEGSFAAPPPTAGRSKPQEQVPHKIIKHPFVEVIRDAVPKALGNKINGRTLSRLASALQERGWTQASIHLALREHDWESAEGAGAIVTWLEDCEPPAAHPDCQVCKGTGYEVVRGDGYRSVSLCYCVQDEPRLGVPGVDFAA